MTRPLGLLLLFVLLTACAPAAEDARTAVVLVNAPAEHRVMGLTESFQELLERDPAAGLYRFAFPASVRFQETHRDMFGRRAPRQAYLIARNLGARYAVMVGAPVYSRAATPLRSPLDESRLVNTAVTVEVSIVAPGGEEIVFRSRAGGVASRLESAQQPLVDEADDPDLRRLRERALAELTPATAARLAGLARF